MISESALLAIAADADVDADVVGRYDSYTEAVIAVEYLTRNQLPMEVTAIRHRGLAASTPVTRRASRREGRRAVLASVVRVGTAAALVGVLVATVLALLGAAGVTVVGVVVMCTLLGVTTGAAVGLLAAGGTSPARPAANYYDLMAGRDVADEARRLLQHMTAPGTGRLEQV